MTHEPDSSNKPLPDNVLSMADRHFESLLDRLDLERELRWRLGRMRARKNDVCRGRIIRRPSVHNDYDA